MLESLELMIGKRILVGVTYLASGGQPSHSVQFAGTVIAVDPLVTIDCGQSEPFTLPAVEDAYDIAPPGTYTFKESGEVVENPDFITTSTVGPPDE